MLEIRESDDGILGGADGCSHKIGVAGAEGDGYDILRQVGADWNGGGCRIDDPVLGDVVQGANVESAASKTVVKA
jgi:hypothetical protein